MTESERYQSIDARLYIDVGNTRIKAAVLTNEDWQIIFSAQVQDIAKFKTFCKSLPTTINEIRCASVVSGFPVNYLPKTGGKHVKEITISGVDPRYISYRTVSTLGIDRFLACLGAWHHSREAIVVVDAGTACTIDFMDCNRVFHGGYITPGLAVREKGLREFAPSLPGVERELPDIWPGQSTKESIQWGITGGFINEIKSAVQNYRRQFGDLQVWLTGGDAAIVEKYLSIPYFRSDYLVFEGMRVYPSVEV